MPPQTTPLGCPNGSESELQKHPVRIIVDTEPGFKLIPCLMVEAFSRLMIIYLLQFGMVMFHVFNNDLLNSFQFMSATNHPNRLYNTRQSRKAHVPYAALVLKNSLTTRAQFSGIRCRLHLQVLIALYLFKGKKNNYKICFVGQVPTFLTPCFVSVVLG